MPSWLHEIDHTGDVGIEVDAPDMATLFERAAWGMFTILTDPDAVTHETALDVELDAADRNDLMLRWLSELNFLHITEGILLSMFLITSIGDRHVAATVHGEAIDPDRHTVHTEIKAVTYHELSVEEGDDGWHAHIIFDL